ncbi:hypothetical protein V3468_04985 [Flavobacterium oreochromis]|uniref:hypothetical protein n=1 Tax=Flavobacterium oreochromis TaxID=2906078 RepID=UPI00385E4002
MENLEPSRNDKSFRLILIESSIIISTLIIFFGFIKQSWYYGFFNIDIQQFISIDEILILFLNEISFITKIILYIVAYHLVYHLLILFVKRKEKSKNQYAFYEKIGIILNDEIGIKFFFYLSTLMLIISLCFFFYLKDEISLTIATSVSFVSVLSGLDLLDFSDNNYAFLIATISSITLLLFLKNERDINQVMLNNQKNTYSLKIENETLKTGNEFIFLGKTKDYYYIYNRKNKFSRIIKAEEVKEVSIAANK